MAKPFIHAISSAKKFGGKAEDYLPIHDFLDSSKGAIADNRHRALTHNSWFLSVVLERVFGSTITNSARRKVSVREIGEQHVLEDFKMRFIPSAVDFLAEMEFKSWMNNGKGCPPSFARIFKKEGSVLTEGGFSLMDVNEILAAKREIEKKIEELRAALTMKGGGWLVGHYRLFFEKYPEVKGITWTQYTPYFNDGGDCEFTSHREYLDVLVGDDDDDEDEDGCDYSVTKEARDMFPDLTDDDMLALFGDHVKVTIRPNEVEVDDYDHG